MIRRLNNRIDGRQHRLHHIVQQMTKADAEQYIEHNSAGCFCAGGRLCFVTGCQNRTTLFQFKRSLQFPRSNSFLHSSRPDMTTFIARLLLAAIGAGPAKCARRTPFRAATSGAGNVATTIAGHRFRSSAPLRAKTPRWPPDLRICRSVSRRFVRRRRAPVRAVSSASRSSSDPQALAANNPLYGAGGPVRLGFHHTSVSRPLHLLVLSTSAL